MATTRKTFSAATDDDQQQPAETGPTRYPCHANRCPMAGAIFPAGAKHGECRYHYGANFSDWPRITQVILDWDCVSREINIGRQMLTGVFAKDPRVLEQKFLEALDRLRPAVASGGWGDTFNRKKGENYEDWVRMLERFIDDRLRRTLAPAHEQATMREWTTQ